MERYEIIDDVIQNISNEQIKGVLPCRGLAYILLTVGSALLIAGVLGLIPATAVNTVLVIIGLVIAIYGIIKIIMASKPIYIYEPTGKKMKKYSVYVTSDGLQKIRFFLTDVDVKSLKGVTKEMNSSKMLVIIAPDDGDIALAQLFEYIPHNYEPTSEVFVLKNHKAKDILEFCKS